MEKNNLSDFVHELTELWLNWINLNEITNNESFSFKERRKRFRKSGGNQR